MNHVLNISRPAPTELERRRRIMATDRWRPFGTVERWDPFRGLGEIQNEVNRLFDTWGGRPASTAAADRMWLPAVDVQETKDDIVLTFDVPGISEKDMQVTMNGDLLTVKGERRFERDAADNNSYHRLERLYGKFERGVQLPFPVQGDKIKATYRDGVLTVTLPKADELKPREIKIDVL
jgi:HSP20 family protein